MTLPKPGFIYRHPWAYQLMLQAVHGQHLPERYKKIVEELGNAQSVFEPLCGPALLPAYLHSGVAYSGFDINPHFVRYAMSKGRNVCLGDARTDAPFEVKADGVVLVDALHHLHPYEEQQRVVEKAARAGTQKVIICDPFGDRYLDMVQKFPVVEPLARWFYNWVERDGPNQSRYDHIITRDTLERRMDDGFGVLRGVSHTIQQVGPEDLIVTYTLKA